MKKLKSKILLAMGNHPYITNVAILVIECTVIGTEIIWIKRLLEK